MTKHKSWLPKSRADLVTRFWEYRRDYGAAFWHFSGAFFREASVLVLVFGLLDRSKVSHPSWFWYAFWIVVIAGGSFFVGMWCWRRAENSGFDKRFQNAFGKRVEEE